MHYVDIGARHVQGWLTATPKLDHLRGASAALRAEASAHTIQQWLTSTGSAAALCASAGDKDGVVVLECSDAAAAHEAACELVAHLAERLPRVEWEGWSAEASTYLTAYAKAEGGAADVRRYAWLPAGHEMPLIEQCEECRNEPRSRGNSGGLLNGADCRVRLANTANAQDILTVIPGEWPKDFQELARKGGLGPDADPTAKSVGRKESRNHLALVKADGNKVGALFRAISEHEAELPTLVANAVKDLDEHTQSAVVLAAREVTAANAPVKGAIAHYVGGDDVLVSVPASSAWTFAGALIGAFEQLQGTWLKRLATDAPREEIAAKIRDLIDQVSLGVGVVFAHETHPLAETFALADQAMAAAKKAARGRHSASAWVDLTAEGMAGATRAGRWLQTVVGSKLRLELASGGDEKTLTDQVMALPPSARAQLSLEIRDASTEAAAIASVVNWCQRRQPGTADHIAEAASAKRVDDIAALLSRARWWPLAAQEEKRS